MRFLHFKFGRNYKEYLDMTDEDAQRKLVNDEEKEAVVYLHCSGQFNIQTREGRRLAFCHTLALVNKQESKTFDMSTEAESELSDHFDASEEDMESIGDMDTD
jgi:hypothetical protein